MINQNYAGTKQLVYLSPVPDWDAVGSMATKIWHNGSRVNNPRPVYGFNLAGIYKDEGVGPSYADWMPIWASSYKDDMGSSIYTPLETGFPISKMAQFNAVSQFYTADFSISPLIPNAAPAITTDYNGSGNSPYGITTATWDSEKYIYDMSVNLAYPILVQTTVAEDNSAQKLGPVFPEGISFAVEDEGNVKIDVKLKGGKYFTPDLEIVEPEKNSTVYRSANFIDCFCDFELVKSTSLFSPSIDSQIISMSLNIEQKYNFQFTCSDNVDIVGPSFVELTGRNVTGSIKFIAKEGSVNPFGGITMYFGGPFYFKMRNTRWQMPTLAIETDRGYLHTYNFIALADTEATLSKTPDILQPTCSEFLVGA